MVRDFVAIQADEVVMVFTAQEWAAYVEAVRADPTPRRPPYPTISVACGYGRHIYERDTDSLTDICSGCGRVRVVPA